MSRNLKKAASGLIALIMAVAMAAGLSSCYDDPYNDSRDWYLSGVYANDNDYYETYTFHPDGTGIYQSYYNEMEFDYYCQDGSIFFIFYPQFGPSYHLNCGITTDGRRSIIITYPPTNGAGYTSQRYTLVGW